MTLFRVWTRFLALAALAFALSGCFPVGDSPADEEKDPHYLAGKNRLNSMDFDGAIEAFENALASNPKSAAAHLQLGFLYEEKRGDYATAIHHYQKHLELKPDSNMAETLKQRILSCKLQLARTVSFALVSGEVQNEIRTLNSSNVALHAQIERLKSELVDRETTWSNKLQQLTEAHRAALSLAQAQAQAQVQAPAPSRRVTEVESRPAPSTRYIAGSSASYAKPAGTPRSHVVRPGETLATISRRYNVKLSSLQSANPTVEPRRLRAGQVLKIP